MNALKVAQRYFDAWNLRDSMALTEIFASGGTYSDPVSGGTLSGAAIADYAQGLWQAFADLSFEIVSCAHCGNGAVAGQWLMRGTNTGSFKGLPPTGRAVVVSGADFIEVEGDKIRAVQGYFDSRSVPDQLGLQVIVQPHEIGPFGFGTSTRTYADSRTKPGAFSITCLEARTDDEVAKIKELGRIISSEMTKLPGFISTMAMTVGRRMMTVTAWENSENPRQLHSGGSHVEAMRKFFSPELSAGGYTSVWVPARINTLWVRCPACSKMADSEIAEGKCSCGAALPQPMCYW